MTDPRTLLAEYVTKGSEAAFRELVAGCINLVYATAVRLVDGDTHRAEDVVQTVFSDLARLAGTLSPEVMLGGWLHRRTCHVAASVMRSERRRQNREREAAEMNAPQEPAGASFEQIAPVLDEAINQLGAEDRAAITLRFLEGRDLRSVGEALGSNEDAAQKRVARALEKLRGLLVRRGVTTSGAALAAVLSAQALTAAPAGLAASVSAAALTGAAASSGGLTLTALKLMSMAKLKIAVGTVVVAGLGTTLILEHQALAKLREQNHALEQQVAQLRQAAQRPPPAGAQAPGGDRTSPGEDPLRDLNRLRREVGTLRQQPSDLASLRAKNRELHEATDEPEDPVEAEFKEQTEMRMNHLKQWGLSFLMYANDHNNQLPETFEQAASIQGSEPLLGFDTNHFEIVYRGSTEGVADPGKTIIFRERQARRSPKGEWVQVYGFADGHVEVHTELDEAGFAAWERERIVAASTGTNTSPARP
jgi:RNA polymerase sigma factor (sigma-70 family)